MDYQNLTKVASFTCDNCKRLTFFQDRSLGSVELHVNEIAKKSETNTKYPYESTGKKTAADPIHFGKSDVYKGTLHYTAEFIPALALRGVHFETGGNEMERALEGEGEGDDGTDAGESVPTSAASDIEMPIPFVPTAKPAVAPASAKLPTTPKKGHTKNQSVESKASVETFATGKTKESVKTAATVPEENGIFMSKADLLKERMLSYTQ